MTLDTFGTIVCAVGAMVGRVVYNYLSENVKLTYKEQRVGVRTKWWRR